MRKPKPEPRARPMPAGVDYRRLRQDFPPGGETAREQGYGAPADSYPPAEQASEEYVETPESASAGDSAPDEPDLPPPEGSLPDHERGAVTLADAARDEALDETTWGAPPPRTPPAFRPPNAPLSAPPEAIEMMSEERGDLRDPADELEEREEQDQEEIAAVAAASRAAREAERERGIDEALSDTFPASDPIALANPRRTT